MLICFPLHYASAIRDNQLDDEQGRIHVIHVYTVSFQKSRIIVFVYLPARLTIRQRDIFSKQTSIHKQCGDSLCDKVCLILSLKWYFCCFIPLWIGCRSMTHFFSFRVTLLRNSSIAADAFRFFFRIS